MEATDLDEIPSVSRTRLSLTLDLPDAGTADRLTTLRRSSILRPHGDPPRDGDGRDGGGDDRRRPSLASRRPSLGGRKASTITNFFALASTSDSFIERGWRPYFITAMMYLSDPDPDPRKLRRVFADRLLDIPRFRSTFSWDSEAKGVRWDPILRSAVDLEYHVRAVDGRGEFDARSMEKMISDTYMNDWDTTRPLWRMTIISNLKDGRSVLFFVIDHAIGDGVAMLQVMLSLLDDPPEGKKKVKTFQKKRRSASSPLRLAHRTVNFLAGAVGGLVEAMAPPNDPPNPFKIPLGQCKGKPLGKSFVQTRAFCLDEMKAIKNKLVGATINDLVMALLVIAMRRYLEGMRDPTMDRFLCGKEKMHMEFVVNMRSQAVDKVTNLGNAFTLGLLAIPFSFSDPIDCVWKCKAKTDLLKTSPCFYIKKMVTDALHKCIPPDFLAKKLVEEGLPSTILISNVMGPPEECSLAGYTLSDLNFTVLHPGGLYCGVLSYNQRLRISLIVDNLADGDGNELRDCLEGAYSDLKRAVFEAAPDVADVVEQPAPCVPLSAKILEFACVAVVLSVPVLVAHTWRGA